MLDEETFNKLQQTVIAGTVEVEAIKRVLSNMGKSGELDREKKLVIKLYPELKQAMEILKNKKF